MHAGIYIHIPFCRSHCSYCDFATGMFEGELADRYVSSLITEITRWNEVETLAAVDTIYLGGGTPSLLTPSQIERIVKAVHDRFDFLVAEDFRRVTPRFLRRGVTDQRRQRSSTS